MLLLDDTEAEPYMHPQQCYLARLPQPAGKEPHKSLHTSVAAGAVAAVEYINASCSWLKLYLLPANDFMIKY